jgi:MarR family transcriptional regulator, transcriptional regulator for hemolysin
LFLTASGRQLVDDLDSLRDSIAADVLQDIPTKSLQTSLDTLKDIKERIKGFAESGDIAAK